MLSQALAFQSWNFSSQVRSSICSRPSRLASGAEGVQFAQVLHELHRVVHAIDAKLQRVHVVRIEMDLRLLARSKRFAVLKLNETDPVCARPAEAMARTNRQTACGLIEGPREERSNDTPRESYCWKKLGATVYRDGASGRPASCGAPRPASLSGRTADRPGIVNHPVVSRAGNDHGVVR